MTSPGLPHLFDPDQLSRTSALYSVKLIAANGQVITGQSMALCTVCKSGERYRVHQPWWWRRVHPLRSWR